MNQRIHIHHDENDTPRRMIADYEREQARERDDAQSGIVVGMVVVLLVVFAAGLGLGLLIGGV